MRSLSALQGATMKQHWPKKEMQRSKTTLYPNNPKTQKPIYKTSSHKSETHTYLPFGRRFGRLAAWARSCHFELLLPLFKKPATRGWSEENKLNNKPASKPKPSKTSISPNKCMMYAQLQVEFTNLQNLCKYVVGQTNWLTVTCNKMKWNEFHRRKWRTI